MTAPKSSQLVLVGLSFLALASHLDAAPIKADPRCGPPIARETVKVVDVSELDEGKAASFIQEQIGPIEVVKRTSVQTRNAFGRAWKKAEGEAAEMGCPFVVVLSSGQVRTGGAVVINPTGPVPMVAPVRRNEAHVLIAKPASTTIEPPATAASGLKQSKPSTDGSRELPAVHISTPDGLKATVSGRVFGAVESAQVGWLVVVANDSNADAHVPEIKFFLIDGDGVPLHESHVEPFDLQAGESRSVRGIERLAGVTPSNVAAIALQSGS